MSELITYYLVYVDGDEDEPEKIYLAEDVDELLDTQASTIEQLREAVRLGIGFAKTKKNSPAWNEEYDRRDLDTMKAALERSE